MALYTPPSDSNRIRGRAENVSAETHALNDAVAAWAKKRWPGCRVLRELVLGDRRIDLLVVCEMDLVGIETKGPKDNMIRVKEQMKEYRRFAPEVWLVVDDRFAEEKEVRWERNVLLHDRASGALRDPHPRDKKWRPFRDELAIMRLLELLWTNEVAAIAGRQDVAGGPIHKQLRDKVKLRKLCARLLTGNEILKEVCKELRSRPLTGIGSDEATR